ncbi:MAG: IQ calmodulin-binding motif-containing protein, partial [archaeon]|nr:IQ calmodulin-binding motif-containing protein [archaeon]
MSIAERRKLINGLTMLNMENIATSKYLSNLTYKINFVNSPFVADAKRFLTDSNKNKSNNGKIKRKIEGYKNDNLNNSKSQIKKTPKNMNSNKSYISTENNDSFKRPILNQFYSEQKQNFLNKNIYKKIPVPYRKPQLMKNYSSNLYNTILPIKNLNKDYSKESLSKKGNNSNSTNSVEEKNILVNRSFIKSDKRNKAKKKLSSYILKPNTISIFKKDSKLSSQLNEYIIKMPHKSKRSERCNSCVTHNIKYPENKQKEGTNICFTIKNPKSKNLFYLEDTEEQTVRHRGERSRGSQSGGKVELKKLYRILIGDKVKPLILIQKHIRGFLLRMKYKNMKKILILKDLIYHWCLLQNSQKFLKILRPNKSSNEKEKIRVIRAHNRNLNNFKSHTQEERETEEGIRSNSNIIYSRNEIDNSEELIYSASNDLYPPYTKYNSGFKYNNIPSSKENLNDLISNENSQMNHSDSNFVKPPSLIEKESEEEIKNKQNLSNEDLNEKKNLFENELENKISNEGFRTLFSKNSNLLTFNDANSFH